MSLPAGWVLKKLGYQRGIVLGPLVMAGGALLFSMHRDDFEFA